MTWRLLLLPIFLLLAVLAGDAVAQNVGVVVRTVEKPPAERGAVEALLAEAAAARGLVAQSDLLSAATGVSLAQMRAGMNACRRI